MKSTLHLIRWWIHWPLWCCIRTTLSTIQNCQYIPKESISVDIFLWDKSSMLDIDINGTCNILLFRHDGVCKLLHQNKYLVTPRKIRMLQKSNFHNQLCSYLIACCETGLSTCAMLFLAEWCSHYIQLYNRTIFLLKSHNGAVWRVHSLIYNISYFSLLYVICYYRLCYKQIWV